jgi:uncharacterized protein (TIGR02246 family)
MKRVLMFLVVLGGAAANWSWGQQTGGQPAEEAAIRKRVAMYVEAYNKHDAKALGDFWSPDAVYVNRLSGEESVGRAAIVAQFEAAFKERPQARLDVSPASIQFMSPNVAVEQGTAKLLVPKAEPEEIEYNAVYVKRDGQWLLDRVTDKAKPSAPSHYQQLKVLEWMVGRWVDKDDKVDIETECKWTKNQSFLTRSFTVSVEGRQETSGLQIVGWDAAAKTIRSWTFDSDGGYAEATWTRKGDRWFIRNKGVLADGRQASMVNVIKPVDDNSFTWQTVERTAGGELLPNTNEVLIVRE